MAKKSSEFVPIVLPDTPMDPEVQAWSDAVDRFEPEALSKLTRETLRDAFFIATKEAEWHASHLQDGEMFERFRAKAQSRADALAEAMKLQEARS